MRRSKRCDTRASLGCKDSVVCVRKQIEIE